MLVAVNDAHNCYPAQQIKLSDTEISFCKLLFLCNHELFRILLHFVPYIMRPGLFSSMFFWLYPFAISMILGTPNLDNNLNICKSDYMTLLPFYMTLLRF